MQVFRPPQVREKVGGRSPTREELVKNKTNMVDPRKIPF
jgi:hypothetical protein